MVAWQDLHVSGSEGHSNERKILGQCELMECLESVMQPKNPHLPRVQSRGKQNQEILLHLSRDLKIKKKNVSMRELWAHRGGKDCVTWPGV